MAIVQPALLTDASAIDRIVLEHGSDRSRLIDVLVAVQGALGSLPDSTLVSIATALALPLVEVVEAASFYAFFSREPQGRCQIRFSKTPISLMHGAAAVVAAFEEATGARIGTVSADGIVLSWTSDIGMADQEPACLVNGLLLTRLVPADAAAVVREIRAMHGSDALPHFPGYTLDQSFPSAKAGCSSNIRLKGDVLFAPYEAERGLRNALAMTPDAVIAEVTKSGLRGRGGAGFPTGLKWHLTRRAPGAAHYTVCNADEGEPGTFKDRVLLSDAPDLVLDGMTIAGYALGATLGLMYLRAEYAFLVPALLANLEARRARGLLGKNVAGQAGFDFDIRLQIGVGAYICGEESALLESLEGKRGSPRDRPPYPTDHGYLGQPTAVNNVETLACVPRILERGAAWFSAFGTAESKGTKLMSVSGDCTNPGIFEVPFGTTLNELLDLAGGADAEAVQVSGAAGTCVAPKDFGRGLSYEDLSTAGSTMVFGPERDVLDIVLKFAEFFADESCGWCTPCRVGTTLLREAIRETIDGRATEHDLVTLESLAQTVVTFSRCGLGQSAPNPILSTLRNFPQIYRTRLAATDDLAIDMASATADAAAIQRATMLEQVGA
jgi:[NiFe] hydrogenase diaphorase moiety large subunit